MSIVYQNNILIGTTKVGTIKPDANGYREVVLGAFNVYNSGGAYYPIEPFKNLLLSSSNLMRRIKDRALRSEYGHPRKGSMTQVEFLARVLDILEEKTCCHIMGIELDENRVKDKETGQSIHAIVGKVFPSGPHGLVLEKQFNNPEESVSFSIRSITNDRIDSSGVLIKEIKEVVTWDYVNEPGISYAKKGYSPSVESFDVNATEKDLDYVVFDEATILQAREYVKSHGIGNESNLALFDKLLTKGEVTTPYGTFYKKRSSSRWSR